MTDVFSSGTKHTEVGNQPGERRRVRPTNPYIRFSGAEIEGSITERFERQVATYPEKIAVKAGEYSLTYDALDRAANQLAHAILEERVDGEKPIAFLLEHGIPQLIAIFGILKSGKIYTPLDPSFPHARISLLLEDSQAGLLVTNDENLPLAEELSQNRMSILNLEKLDPMTPTDSPRVSISPDAVTNIYYTSGSTGQPKGVFLNHRNLLHSIMSTTNNYHLCAEDRVALLLSASYAGSMASTFGGLLNGATVCPYSLKGPGLVHLAEWLSQEKITFCVLVSSAFRRFVDTLKGTETFPHLRLIVLAGEPVYRRDVELYKEHFSDDCILCVRLAGTETHEIRSYFIDKETRIPESLVPVGYALIDKDVRLMDDDSKEVPINEVGEIVVSSRYLALGYWLQPDLTQEDFRPDPDGGGKRVYRTGNLGRMRPDACLEYLGRKDSLVKVRGYRIELGEIEKALLNLENVKEAVVVTQEYRSGHQYIVAYVVPQAKPDPTVNVLRAGLSETLPDYMIPHFFVVLEAMPVTPSGKIDRLMLPKLDWKRPKTGTPFVAPRDEMERHLVEICGDVLGIHPIGIRDRFVDLGFDSILYVCFFMEIEERLGRQFSFDFFVDAQNIEELADLFRAQDSAPPKPSAQEIGSIDARSPGIRISYTYLEVNNFLKKALKIVIFSVLEKCGGVIPYSSGTRLLSKLCGRKWVQASPFRKLVRLIRRLLPAIESRTSEAKIIYKFLMCNSMVDLRIAILSRFPTQRFERWVEIVGISTFLQSHGRGQGVVLVNSHYGPSHFDVLPLHRLGIEDIITMGGAPTEFELLGLEQWNQMKVEYEPSMQFRFGLSSLYVARQFLGRGGIVRMAPDGLHGTSGIFLPFMGRALPFRAGFAHLALTTGADAIPVFTSLDTTGKVRMEFMNPLKVGSPGMNHQDRVEFLIRQYAGLLEKKWREDPGNIQWKYLRQFLALEPAVEEEESSQEV
ncbi:MAG: AMP-binding protein [Deltaproteobacteria bacterium]|nr:AMP-binding protein [Deltaproteobacteria bacterium]